MSDMTNLPEDLAQRVQEAGLSAEDVERYARRPTSVRAEHRDLSAALSAEWNRRWEAQSAAAERTMRERAAERA